MFGGIVLVLSEGNPTPIPDLRAPLGSTEQRERENLKKS